MRRIISLILSLMMVLSVVPAEAASYAQLANKIYDITFDDKTASDLVIKTTTEYVDDGNGGLALSVTPREDNKPLAIDLKQLQRNSCADISLDLRLASEMDSATAKLIIRVSSGQDYDYVLDTQTITKDKWATLSGRFDTTLMNISGNVQVVLDVNTDGMQQQYEINNMTVYSDKVSKGGAVVPVPDIQSEYTGNLLKRATFEVPTIDMFYSSTLLITDEAGSHTGQYAVKIIDRTADWHCVTTSIKDQASVKAKFTVSAWVKKDPDKSSETFRIQHYYTTAVDKKSYWNASAPVVVADNEWHQVTGELDTTGVEGDISEVVFRVWIGDKNYSIYYVDDFIVRSDTQGEFYDDLLVDPNVRPEGISSTAIASNPMGNAIEEDIPSLKDVYKDYFKIGACSRIFANFGQEYEDTMHGQLIMKHFNSIVHDGAMKPPNCVDESQLPRCVYNFTEGDFMMDFAFRNGITDVAGHTLTWDSVDSVHSQMLKDENGDDVSQDVAHAILKDYVQTVVRHFEGDGDPSEYTPGMDYKDWHVAVWDIANESVYAGDMVFSHNKGFAKILGNMEAEYWTIMYAEQAGSYGIKWRYNDYGEQDNGKRVAVADHIKRFQNMGAPIGALGIQSHYRINVLPSQIRKAFEMYSSLGVELNCTELDLSAYTDGQVHNRELLYENGVTIEAETAQANFYYELFQIYKDFAGTLTRVTFWTFEDAGSYQNQSDGFPRKDYAGIFDRRYEAKPQFWAIADPDYYFENILKEDTSKVRVVIDGLEVSADDYEIREENGTAYMRADQLLDNLGIQYVVVDGKYSFIGKGVFMTVSEGKSQYVAFADKEFTYPIFVENGQMYVPVLEFCEQMTYTAEYNERRNIAAVSSNQVSNNL